MAELPVPAVDEHRSPAGSTPASEAGRVGGRPATQAPGLRWAWSRPARILVLASLVASFLATSSAPTPLYASYARAWHLTAAGTSLAFGVYALSLLAVLLLAGRLSDHVGRRPVMFAAAAGQIVALAVLATAGGLPALLVARVLQGISTGLGVPAIGAALLDVDAERAAVANSVAPAAGSAVGAMSSALAVQFLPAPMRLIYGLLAGVLAGLVLVLLRLPETSPRAPGALASLRPEVRLPASARGRFVAAAPVLLRVCVLGGGVGGLGPGLVHQVTGSASAVAGSVPLAIVGVLSSLTAYGLRRASPISALALGVAALGSGVVVTMAAVWISSAPVLFAGALLAGIGFGSGFRGGMQLVLPVVAAGERAGALSLMYIISYLGFGVPAIVAGIVDAGTHDVGATTLGYSGFLLVLALLAVVALRRIDTGAPGSAREDR